MKRILRSSFVPAAAGVLITSLGLSTTAIAKDDNESSLENVIERFVKSQRASGAVQSNERTAWVVYDLTTRQKLASINENTSLQAASMIKPYLALAFFHQVNACQLRYGPISRKHMELMIQKSDNDSTNWVMRQTGGPAKTSRLLKAHYPQLCRQLSLVEYIPAGGRTYSNRESAADYTRFLIELWNKRLPYSTEILRLMGLPGIDRLYTRVRSVPEGTKVFNKTGSTAMCCGDMGILLAKGENGKTYPYILVGIIERKTRTKAYGSWISGRANVIRGVSNLTYQAMARKHHIPKPIKKESANMM